MLGIPVNATATDLAANMSRMILLEIGRAVEFPLDLPGLLPLISRTKVAVTAAEHDINQPQDKVLHALFWFAKPTSMLGEMAYNNLLQGNLGTAVTNFKRCTSWESKLCLATIHLVHGDMVGALTAIASVIDAHCDEFVKAVAGQTYRTDAATLRHNYMSALAEEVDAAELYAQLSGTEVPDSLLSVLRDKAVDAPIKVIEKEMASAKAVDSGNAPAQLETGKVLMKNTQEPYQHLKQLVGQSDLRFSRLADKLANQILQCSINYFNNIEGENREIIENALALGEHALNIAVGKMAKDHIQHNVEILRKKKDNLPPPEVEKEVNAILKALKEFVDMADEIEHSVALLNTTKPYLISMKSKLGKNNELYLQLSTQIVGNALSNVIAEVNSVSTPNYRLGKLPTRDQMKAVVARAWKCIRKMQNFDMSKDFKNDRFRPNLRTLREMCWNLDCGFWWEIMGVIFVIFSLTGLIIGAVNEAPGIGLAIGAGATLIIMGSK